MNGASRSIDEYLQQLRAQLAGEDAALLQDASYDAEEYLRAELAAHPERSEAELLESIASTFGSPEEVAAAYRETELKVRSAMQPPPLKAARTPLGEFFGIYSDPHAYTSLFLMLLSLATGVIYFTFTVVGLALSTGLALLIVGVPFFLLFIGIARVIALAEGRLLEATTGERMPRRPVHPGAPAGFWARIGAMLCDWRTWSTLLYLLLMLPLGIAYFTIAVAGLSASLALILAPLAKVCAELGWLGFGHALHVNPTWLDSWWAAPLVFLIGVALLTILLHLARGIGRIHAQFAKILLVARGADEPKTAARPAGGADAGAHPDIFSEKSA